MRSAFNDLVAYRLSVQLADELRPRILRWSPFDRGTVGFQLIRALDSVGANIAEANGRWNDADKRRLFRVARGSLYEAEHWLDRAEARDLLPKGTKDRLTEIARTLNGLIKQPR